VGFANTLTDARRAGPSFRHRGMRSVSLQIAGVLRYPLLLGPRAPSPRTRQANTNSFPKSLLAQNAGEGARGPSRSRPSQSN
jgi:hypothetical protein